MAKKLKPMNANEIGDLMEQVVDRLLFVHRTKGSIVSGARLYDILTSLSTILDLSRCTMPNIADSIEEIRADIKDVANGCMGGESLPRAEMRPGGLMLPRCAKRLRDMARKTKDEREPQNLMAVSIIPKYFKVTSRTIYRHIPKRFTPYPDVNGLIRVDAVEVKKYYPLIRK